MGTKMGTGNVCGDDLETLQLADEAEYAGEADAADEVEAAREHFAQNALDHDRNPTEADFVRWLVGQRLELLGKTRRAAALTEMANLVTTVRPHVCFRNAVEVGMSGCAFGCKILRCATCHSTAVVHNPTYGCRKVR